MSTMLELYRHRFGAGVKARGNGWNGPCPICGGEVGKSDRFMIWPDRERDLGYTCTENHIPGVFFVSALRQDRRQHPVHDGHGGYELP